MEGELPKRNLISVLRIFVSVAFLLLGLVKLLYIYSSGLEVYRMVAEMFGFPPLFRYYGVIAVFLEILIAFGVWVKPIFKTSIILVLGLSVMGVAMSVYSLLFKINSDCGCGLLGDNEYSLLFQKGVIVVLLFTLYKNEQYLFCHKRTSNAGIYN